MRDNVEKVLSHVADDAPNVSAKDNTSRTDGVPLFMITSCITDNVVAPGMFETCCLATANSALFMEMLPSFARGSSLSYDKNANSVDH